MMKLKIQTNIPLPTQKRQVWGTYSKVQSLKIGTTITFPVQKPQDVKSIGNAVQAAQGMKRKRYTYRTLIERNKPVVKVWRVS